MPTRNVTLIERQAAFIDQLVESGRFESSNEVFFETIKLIEMVLTDPKANRCMLFAAIQQGIDDIEAGRFTELETEEEFEAHLSLG